MNPTPEEYARLHYLFVAARELSRHAQPEFLRKVRQTEGKAMAEKLEALLKADAEPTDTKDQPFVRREDRIPPQAPTFSADDLISGRYRIVRFVTKGGMGEVYEARDLELEETVALKTLVANSKNEESLARFKREIQLARKVIHPNVCRTYDLGHHNHARHGDVLYLTMEFIRGETLSRRIERIGCFPEEDALAVVRQMVGALSAAHELGIIHRDFKSANVMLATNGPDTCVKVTDFGLARNIGPSEGGSLTGTCQAMGTPPYMPPEQFQGEATKASDIFSLGVVMYEMITGVRPFHLGTQAERLVAPSPRALCPKLDPRWEAAIVKCLQPEPLCRYASVDCVETALLGEDQQKKVQIPRQRTRPASGTIRSLGAALLVILLLASIGFWFLYRARWFERLPEQKHLAVLPFRYLGQNPGDEVFCEGLMETLASRLSQLERYKRSFWVVPAMDSRKVTDAETAYRRLGANLVVTGTFERLAQKGHLIVNLVDTRNHRQLDSKILDTPSEDLSTLEGEAWLLVADMLDLHLDATAVRALEAGMAKSPGAYEYYEQGLGYLRRNGLENLKYAAALFLKSISIDPSYALPYAGLGSAYQLMNEVTGDSHWLEESKRNAVRAAELGSGLAPVHLTLGGVAFASGQNHEARSELRKALELDPGLIEAQFYLGRLDERESRLQDARQQFESAVVRRPGYWRVHSELASFYYRHGNLLGAEKQFKEVLGLQPDDTSTYSSLAGVYMALGRFDEAIGVLQKEILVEPSNGDAYSNLGSCFLLIGNYQSAIAPLERAVELKPEDHNMWRNLGDAYLFSKSHAGKAGGAYRRASELARRELSVNPENADTMSSLALYDARTNEAAEALRLAERAKSLEPNNGEILFTVSLVYEILGQRGVALQNLRRASENGYSQIYIEREPALDNLRKDSRFVGLLQRNKIE